MIHNGEVFDGRELFKPEIRMMDRLIGLFVVSLKTEYLFMMNSYKNEIFFVCIMLVGEFVVMLLLLACLYLIMFPL